MTAEDDWNKFTERAAILMREALSDKGSFLRRSLHRRKAFDRVVEFINFENAEFPVDAEIRGDIFNLLMEVGGNGPQYFVELLQLFEAHASEADVRRYLNS